MSYAYEQLDPPEPEPFNRCPKCYRFVSTYEVEEHWALGAMFGSEPGDDFHTVTKKAPCKRCDLDGWLKFREWVDNQ